MLVLGRILLGGFFVYNGLQHFLEYDAMVAFTASQAVPVPGLAVTVSGLLLLFGGMSLLLGLWPKVGAGMIILFLVGVTPVMHDFWNVNAPQARMMQMTNFLKNLALIGAACLAAALPEPWPLSVHRDRTEPLN